MGPDRGWQVSETYAYVPILPNPTYPRKKNDTLVVDLWTIAKTVEIHVLGKIIGTNYAIIRVIYATNRKVRRIGKKKKKEKNKNKKTRILTFLSVFFPFLSFFFLGGGARVKTKYVMLLLCDAATKWQNATGCLSQVVVAEDQIRPASIYVIFEAKIGP